MYFMMKKLLTTLFTIFILLPAFAFAGPGDVKVAWDANDPTDNVTTYRLYYGTETGVYTGSVDVPSVPVDVNGIQTLLYTLKLQGGKYFSAVTAVNDTGLESDYSNEIQINLPKRPKNYKKDNQGNGNN